MNVTKIALSCFMFQTIGYKKVLYQTLTGGRLQLDHMPSMYLFGSTDFVGIAYSIGRYLLCLDQHLSIDIPSM